MNKIRKGYIYKVISVYLSLSIMLPGTTFSTYGLTSGPSQPEFNSFTPISTSDMVNLSSGDFNYNIPLMDVGGYPINIAYDSGITMDQEASWVGLGWNLNIGQINRQVRGLPDDFNGDEMIYENKMKDNITYGTNVHVQPAIFGSDFPVNVGIGLGVEWNNYEGISFHPSAGVTYSMSDNVSVGLNVSSSTAGGANVSPSVSLSTKKKYYDDIFTTYSANVGVTMNSRQGLSSLNISGSKGFGKYKLDKNNNLTELVSGGNSTSTGSSISFIDNTFTPSKRVAQKNQNISFSAGFGVSFWGAETDVRITGYGSKQGMESSEKYKEEKAYGYEFTEQNNDGILDFNREKDRSVNKNTTMLPITNYTYDIYSIQGQGIGGMFRPFRSQVSHVYDKKITDKGNGGSIGVEIAPGAYFHGGIDIKINKSTSYTGLWDTNNFAKTIFDESKNESEKLDYEKVYFRTIGELDVDPENAILYTQLHGDAPIKIGIGGGKYNRKATREFLFKEIGANGQITKPYPKQPINTKIKRTKRQLRNKSIQKITNKEANDYNDNFIKANANAEPHHTVGMKVLNENGSTYIYGKAAYNTKKIEATFAVNAQGNCNTGLVNYASTENTSDNSSGIDQFYNKIHTPAYAHTYLLTAVLSSDYEDLTGDGPTDDDLGSYTKFSYDDQKEPNYRWRVPYQVNTASFNEGSKSLDKDQKGNYIYGEKELLYIDKIETKTHIAIFELLSRDDARGVINEDGGGDASSGHMFKINKISLYSKPEYKANSTTAVPIKEVHFDYDYSLVQGVPNNLNGGGKLTLKKIYFTYQNSKMGKYTPYQFNYEQTDVNGNILPEADYNPQYNLKGYDIWGNYKENTATGCDINSDITTAEFPFVEQQSKDIADKNASMWSLVSIDLPSGGKLELDYESDDYQFVQNRRAMQMYKVVGVGDDPDPMNISSNILYSGSAHNNYVYVKIDDSYSPGQEELFKQNYIGDQIDEPIYFRFLLNMVKNTSWQYDYVSGYFTINNNDINNPFNIIKNDEGTYAAIPIDFLKKEGGWVTSDQNVNPIAKAGWYFGRKYLNRVVYSLGGDAVNDDLGSAMNDLVSSIGGVIEIFKGPNDRLQQKQCAKEFVIGKSWIRLLNPDRRKFGGGVRVKKLVMHDKWDEMTGNLSNSLYKQQYGQIYSYTKEDGTSSGVATFEPNMSKENPFVEPFYDKEGDSKKDKLVAPKEDNFVEKPIGESFFPSPAVTYSRVEVKNLERIDIANNREVKKHATGKVVNEFYTSYDFPTIADYTDVTSNYDKPTTLGSLLKINVRNHLTLSQGFVVHTNDMNGKLKSQRIYAEGQNTAISGVNYKYNIDEKNKLNNKLTTIDRGGNISSEVIGVHYDVVNDFRESYSKSTMIGINANVNVFPVVFFPLTIVTVFPAIAKHENILRMTTTTKVIHSTGILKEKIAYDLGSKVSTENLAWNAETGQVLLTKTVNEYDDAYYNLNYPSHWYYDNMSEASTNLDIQSTFKNIADSPYFSIDKEDINPIDFLTVGDEVFTYKADANGNNVPNEKLWVVDFEDVEIIPDAGNSGDTPYQLMRVQCEDDYDIGTSSGTVDYFVVLQFSNHATIPDGLYNTGFSQENYNAGNLPCNLIISSNDRLGDNPDEYFNRDYAQGCGPNSGADIIATYSICTPAVNTNNLIASYKILNVYCDENDNVSTSGSGNFVVVTVSGAYNIPDGIYYVSGSISDFENGTLPTHLYLGQDEYLSPNIDEYFSLQDPNCGPNSSAYFSGVYTEGNPAINQDDSAQSTIVQGVMLMDRDGKVINGCQNVDFLNSLDFKIVRSGYRNLQTASMASVTSMVNPIDINNDGTLETSISGIYENNGIDYRIVNSSAIEYSDVWKTQCENIFIDFNEADFFAPEGDIIDPQKLWFNPYVYNVKGDWRAKKSYAYLTGRKANTASTSPRNDGFYTSFNPFYEVNGQVWTKNTSNWTFASEVTQYSPYGVEVENKDALGRYSSAQYGYNYTLPTAVASNGEYKEIGFDGFEDYAFKTTDNNTPSNRHFGYYDMLGNTVSINNKHSHTGKNSIAVAGNSSVILQKQLFECNAPIPEVCPVEIQIPVNELYTNCTVDQENMDCESEHSFDLSMIPDGETMRLTFEWGVSSEGSSSAGFTLLKNGIDATPPGTPGSDVTGVFTVEVTNSDTLTILLEAHAYGTPGSNNGGGSSVGLSIMEAIILSSNATIILEQMVFGIGASCC